MMAAAFAEEGEFDTAQQIMKEDEARKDLRPTQRKQQDKRQEIRAE